MSKMRKSMVLLGITAAFLGTAAACGKEAADIGPEKAGEAALADAGVTEEETTRYRVTRDEGERNYEVQFASGGTEYDYEVQASDGKILEVSREKDEQMPAAPTAAPAEETPVAQETPAGEELPAAQETPAAQGTPAPNAAGNPQSAEPGISWEEAAALALARVAGATEQDLRMELDFDDGYLKYEGSIIYNQIEYEFEMDASDGSFLEWSEDRN